MQMHVHMCGGKRATTVSVLSHYPHSFSQTDLSWAWNSLNRLAGQGAAWSLAELTMPSLTLCLVWPVEYLTE